MTRFPGLAFLVLGIVFTLSQAPAAEPPRGAGPARRSSRKPATPPGPAEARASDALTTEQLAARARPSLVTLATRGRDGTGEGVGTGFVIDPDGLVATSLHVIGESRPVTARLASGGDVPILAVHAFDRHTDLAIIRIAATNLTALPLGDSATLAIGAEVVALGNPLGLENSVVAGVLSGRRTLQEIEMLQLAIPIEPGNSGGPLLDRSGRVQGVLNSKSLLTRNLGFATPVNLLKPLLAKPNPVAFERWVRSGTLDPATWEQRLGARWRQRGNRIDVEAPGTGFGGRAFILRKEPVPPGRYEASVKVRLSDESGAAGLVFGDAGEGLHYGFYPTAGQLRLTAFEGPDVFSWRILGTVPSPAYRPGDWNTLRIRHETGRVQCFVNGTEVFNVEDKAFQGRQVGLAKFRDTIAEFREFRAAASLDDAPVLDPGLVMALGGVEVPAARLGEPEIAALRTNLAASRAFLEARARQLDGEAIRLRDLAARLHRDSIRDQLVTELARPEGEIDLSRAALLVARHDDPGVDTDAYRRQLDAMAGEIRQRFAEATPAHEKVDILRRYLFEENGFHGSRHDYYNRANSHLNSVLDDREGLPISLSMVFMALADRAGIAHVNGLPLPGHFVVKHAPPGTDGRIIDVFDGGRYLTHSEADDIGSSHAGVPVRSELMLPATKREMIVRLVTNLQAFTEREEGAAASLRYADLLVAIAGDKRLEAAQRIDRARLRAQTGDLDGSARDLRWILDAAPEGIDLERVADMIRRTEAARR